MSLDSCNVLFPATRRMALKRIVLFLLLVLTGFGCSEDDNTTGRSEKSSSGAIVVAWRDNGAGQCDVPGPNSGFQTVVGGANYSAGLKKN